jgi:hypothetical protein
MGWDMSTINRSWRSKGFLATLPESEMIRVVSFWLIIVSSGLMAGLFIAASIFDESMNGVSLVAFITESVCANELKLLIITKRITRKHGCIKLFCTKINLLYKRLHYFFEQN